MGLARGKKCRGIEKSADGLVGTTKVGENLGYGSLVRARRHDGGEQRW